MQLTLGPKAEKKLRQRMKAGGYGSPEEVLLAGLAALEREQTPRGDFAPGELDALIAEGEASGDPLDWDDVYKELREQSRRKRKAS
jgi:Arc/MetJ-type ribon-helix-helix transcriptional regulator